MTFINVLARSCIVVAGRKYLVLACCFNYAIVVVGMVNSVVANYYPRVSARGVLHQRLSHVLPSTLSCSSYCNASTGMTSRAVAEDPFARLLGSATGIAVDLGKHVLAFVPGARLLQTLPYVGPSAGLSGCAA